MLGDKSDLLDLTTISLRDFDRYRMMRGISSVLVDLCADGSLSGALSKWWQDRNDDGAARGFIAMAFEPVRILI